MGVLTCPSMTFSNVRSYLKTLGRHLCTLPSHHSRRKGGGRAKGIGMHDGILVEGQLSLFSRTNPSGLVAILWTLHFGFDTFPTKKMKLDFLYIFDKPF